ncbi:hypothetical protein BDSB_18155 [Burkholderia dolosa PC543]|nr:hypothetical protein BDSB_18155 [Burkholderia dolosa PC543]
MFTAPANADGLRACEVRHAIRHARADSGLSRLRLHSMCAQLIALERFYIGFCASERRG